MKSKKEKLDQRNKLFVTVVIAVFVLSSVAGVVLYRNGDQAPDNGAFTINSTNGVYSAVQKQDTTGNAYFLLTGQQGSFAAFLLPSQLQSIPIDPKAENIITSANFYYMTFDPSQSGLTYIDYLRFDLRSTLPSGKNFIDGVIVPSSTYVLPVITCQNATALAPVIVLTDTNITNITSSGNCINLSFNHNQILPIRDMLTYLVWGIKIKNQ